MASPQAAASARIAQEVTDSYLRGLAAVSGNPRGWVRHAPGAVAYVSGLPFANLNGLFVHGAEPDRAIVEGLLDELETSGVPFGLRMRPAAGGEVEALASLRGFAVAESLPLMAVAPEAFRPSPPAQIDLRLLGAAEPPIHIDLVALGLGAPQADIAAFMSLRSFSPERWRIYLGEVDGGALAATGTALRSGDSVNLVAIATDPEHRRKGFAAALVSRMVADAFESGARRVFLHSSTMGYPLYEALGFELLEHWTIWTRRD